MYESIRSSSQQFLQSLEIIDQVKWGAFSEKKYRHTYLAGMGGSSLPGDLVNDYLAGEIVLQIVRDYRLPRVVNKADLVICSSYSGNTEETLATFKNALAKGATVVVLAHGGTLEKAAKEAGVFFVRIPEAVQPRQALGYFFTSILGVMEKAGIIPTCKSTLIKLTQFLESKQDGSDKKGEALSRSIGERIPIIYGPTELQGACRIWKIKFNENSKIPSFYNVFPELNHNEMVGWTRSLMNPIFIYLVSQGMHPRVHKRMQVMEAMLKDKIPFYRVELSGEDLLEDIFEAILISDYASYYLAKKLGVDPVPVEMVEEFKKKL